MTLKQHNFFIITLKVRREARNKKCESRSDVNSTSRSKDGVDVAIEKYKRPSKY